MLPRTLHDVLKAIDDVPRSIPIAVAAWNYGMPLATLLYKGSGKTPRQRRMGPRIYLSTDQVDNFVQWIKQCIGML